jgi:hypothetical protein
MRLFFDVHHQDSRSYDYHGREFSRPEEATQMAELIAADLSCTENKNWVGSQVKVKNAAGETLFSVPVMIAA